MNYLSAVLDDNMTLCLANGQRIKLKNEMKCLFEVNDLAVASPATVSRIGVVYMTPSDLGWIPFVKSWAVRDLPVACPVAIREHIITLLFEKIFAEGLAHQRKYGKEPIETVDIQQAISLCTLFQSLFTDPKNEISLSMPLNELKLMVEKLFFFC
jgi:dynein heavy chain